MRSGAAGRHLLTTVAGMRCYCHALRGRMHLPMPRTYHVYIMASLGGVPYIGITGNLRRRIHEHKGPSEQAVIPAQAGIQGSCKVLKTG